MFGKLLAKGAESMVVKGKTVKNVAGGIAAVASAATITAFVAEKGGRMYLRKKKGKSLLGAFKDN